jgi:hypothetical protein
LRSGICTSAKADLIVRLSVPAVASALSKGALKTALRGVGVGTLVAGEQVFFHPPVDAGAPHQFSGWQAGRAGRRR